MKGHLEPGVQACHPKRAQMDAASKMSQELLSSYRTRMLKRLSRSCASGKINGSVETGPTRGS